MSKSVIGHFIIRAFSRLAASALLILCLGFSNKTIAAELAVEGEVDQTPAHLRTLSERAQALELKLKELEQRITETQRSVIGNPNESLIDYRLELKPDTNQYKQTDGMSAFVLSHVRMTLDGRPFVYTQNAIVVSEKLPLPLFLGKIPAGPHQVRIQFQIAPISDDTFSIANSPWRTVDQVIQLDLSLTAGRQQTNTVIVTDKRLQVAKSNSSPKRREQEEASPRIIIKEREVK